MKKRLSDLIQKSYDAPPGTFFQSTLSHRGTATVKQLVFIERISGGIGDSLAEQRFGKSLMELSSAEASMLIETLVH